MKKTKDDNLNNNARTGIGSKTHGSFPKEPMSDRIAASPAMEQELKGIFDSTLGVLQSMCKQPEFSSEHLKTIRMLRNTYFKFYNQIPANRTVPFFPLVDKTDIARIMDGITTHASSDAFLADHMNNPSRNAQPSDEKAGQLAGLFDQMSVIDSVSKLFEETFLSHGEGLVLPDDMEYKAVSLWMERLIEVYPFSGRKSLPCQQSRTQADCALMILTEAEHSKSLVDPRTHKAYSDPLKEHLGKALDSLATLGSKVRSFQLV